MDVKELKLKPSESSNYFDDLPLILTSMVFAFSDNDSLSDPSTHESYELTYIVKGQIDYIIDDKVYHLKPGSTIIVWPGVEHSYEVIEECEVACVYFTLNTDAEDDTNTNVVQTQDDLDDDVKDEKNLDTLFKTSPISQEDIDAVVITGKGQKDIATTVNAILSENSQEAFGRAPLLQALALTMIVYINRSLQEQIEEQKRIQEGSAVELVEIACDFIEENYTENITVADIADYIYLSAGYFSRVFNKEKGISPMNYLTDYRIDKAKHLLETTDLKMSNIATMTGFTTPQRFNAAFKRVTGDTPSDYRKEFQED